MRSVEDQNDAMYAPGSFKHIDGSCQGDTPGQWGTKYLIFLAAIGRASSDDNGSSIFLHGSTLPLYPDRQPPLRSLCLIHCVPLNIRSLPQLRSSFAQAV